MVSKVNTKRRFKTDAFFLVFFLAKKLNLEKHPEFGFEKKSDEAMKTDEA